MGTEIPDVWARTAEISFGGTDVTRHDFYECFEGSSSSVVSDFDAVARLPGRAVCVFRIGFKTVQGHVAFLEKFSNKESVIINDKEVRIRVRDRSINLLRVRIQHFKFDDDLNLLATRLRDFGSVSRIFWDTYQDRSLPKWNGIKTGVVNVDMEIHKNIPSYINFGSYKHPLMVSYAGQIFTCRMCDSPTHVSTDCPKVANIIANPSTNTKDLNGPRTYSSTLRNPAPPKPTASGGTGGARNPIGVNLNNQVFPELAKRPAVPANEVVLPPVEAPGSDPGEPESSPSSDDDADDSSSESSKEASKPPKKKKSTESREFRDQSKRSKKKNNEVPFNFPVEEASKFVEVLAQMVEQESTTPEDPSSSPVGGKNSFVNTAGSIDAEGGASLSVTMDEVPPDENSPEVPSEPTTVDQVDDEEDDGMDTTEVASVSIPEDDLFLPSGSIEPGQRPRDSQEASHVSETQLSLGNPPGTLPTPTKDKTLKALEAIRKKRLQESQKPKPTFRHK